MASEEIVRFFIEEGKEHLDTLENGLLDLGATIQDSEQINELFRAAHSVKGGAAMLGFGSIQKVAHRLEDYFKILKENTSITVDPKLESLFLKGLDALRDLLEMLQSPFGLRDEDANKVIDEVEPVFTDLKSHLDYLLAGGVPIDAITTSVATRKAIAVATNFPVDVLEVLKQMLSVFRKPESHETRQRLVTFCNHLDELGNGNEGWSAIVKMTSQAIINENNPFRILAPITIQELRFASHQLADDANVKLAPSSNLVQLSKIETNEWDRLTIIRQDLRSAAETLTETFEKATLLKLAKLIYKAAQ